MPFIRIKYRNILDSSDYDQAQSLEATLQASELFARSVVDALSANIAIMDERGTIIAVNRAWRQFALINGGNPDYTDEDVNYLAVCDAAAIQGEESSAEMAAGIRAVIECTTDEFMLEYQLQ